MPSRPAASTTMAARYSNLQGQTEDETWAWFKSRIPLQTPKDIGLDGCFPSLRSGGKHKLRENRTRG